MMSQTNKTIQMAYNASKSMEDAVSTSAYCTHVHVPIQDCLVLLYTWKGG